MNYLRHCVLRPVHARFWLKTICHLVTPGGFGYMRKLRKFKDPSYVHARDMHEVRKKHHITGGWKNVSDGDLLQRDYASYEEYVTHQKLKLEEILKKHGGFDNQTITQFRIKFYLRFKNLVGLLYEMGVTAGKNSGGAFEAVTWDRSEDIVIRLLKRFSKLIRVESDESFGGVWFWVLLQGKR